MHALHLGDNRINDSGSVRVDIGAALVASGVETVGFINHQYLSKCRGKYPFCLFLRASDDISYEIRRILGDDCGLLVRNYISMRP